MKKNLLPLILITLFLPALQAASEDENLTNLSIENVQIVMQLEYIQLSFLVRDSKGNLIRNLSVDDFALVENGQPKTISALREQEVPISAVIMVDTSWSIGSYLENAVETALNLFQSLDGERSAFVLFSESPRLVLGWNEKPAAPRFLKDVQTDGKTALHDSVIWAADELFSAESGKKLIILITDGIDTISQASFPEMMRVTRQRGITLYPIIYTNEEIQSYRQKLHGRVPHFRNVSRSFHSFVLLQNEFLEQSMRYGGRTIFSNQFSDLGRIYRDIVREMKSHYVMLYRSDGEEPDEVREVKVSTKRVPGKIFIEVTQ